MTAITETTVLDCGHVPSVHGPHTTGYGRFGDRYLCYACCAQQDLEQLRTATKVVQYISSDGKNLTNWPGHVLGTVLYFGAKHPFSQERRYVRVRDTSGGEWSGVGAPGMYATLRRCNLKGRP